MEMEKLLAMGSQLGLAGAELRKWVEDKQREDRAFARQTAEDERTAAKEADERQIQLMRLKIECQQLEKETREKEGSRGKDAEPSLKLNTSKLLIPFDDRKDDLDAYIRRFESLAESQKWPESQWSTALATCLSGEALSVYGRLPPGDAADYSKVKTALLKRFRFTADGFRDKFDSGKPADGETAAQFSARLSHYFDRWIELSDTKHEFKDLRELLIKERFLHGCHSNMALYLKERKAKSLGEMLDLADQFLEAQGSLNLAKVKKDNRDDIGRPETDEKRSSQRTAPRCYLCNRVGHQASHCRAHTTNNHGLTCFKCGRKGHKADACRSGTNDRPQASCVYSPVGVTNREGIRDGYLELKNGERIPVVNAVMITQPKFLVEGLPVVAGTYEGKSISVLRDTGCNTAIIRRELIRDDQLTGETRPVYVVDGTARMLPEARVEIDTPYYSGVITALCMAEPLYDLILGNIEGARAPDDPKAAVEEPISNEPADEEAVAAVVTRSQMRNQPQRFQTLKAPDVPAQPLNRDYADEQEADESLRPCFSQIGQILTCRDSEGNIEFHREGRLLYRSYTEKTGHVVRQLVVPRCHREAVLKTAHDGIMAGHLGVQKTKDRILEEFFWPGITADVKRFVASCDICQRTIPKGRVTRVPLGKAPLIETPFKRVAIDIVGPIQPPSKHGNRYILTLMDYATRYPEAVALPSIETERVAEALVEMFSRFGVPNEVLSDRGTNFTSDLMKEVARLLSIRQLHTTPYHPMANGMVEKFNGTLKLMLKRMCAEKPRDWDRYLAPLLFAYREVPQASLGFSPFELLYGRHVRGPLAILKELWTNHHLDEEEKTTYHHVFDLRNRLEETCKLAHEELAKAGARYAKMYNRKTKERFFQPGNKVLILLPTDKNKLLLQWKGPFEVKEKKGEADYIIETAGGRKIFHANMLKKYEERGSQPVERVCQAICGVTDSDSDGAIPVPAFRQSEDERDVRLSDCLGEDQQKQLRDVISEHSCIFSDVPGKTDWAECRLELTTDTPVHVKQYPLPFATREGVEREVQEMERLGIIEKSQSPYNAPVLLVKKPDGTNRLCIDFRRLNDVLVADSEPMPRADAVFAAAGEKKYFSKVDFVKGYWQIPLSEESKPKTAFSTTSGLFQFRFMPFGIKTAPAVFSKLMHRVVEGIPGVQHYYDDVLVANATWEEHLTSLSQLFARIETAGLTVRPGKCEFGRENIEFLGHRIGGGELAPLGKTLDRIQAAPAPRTKRQVRAFLGLTGYYRAFIPDYAKISEPLTQLTKKGGNNVVRWTSAHQEAFEELKRRVSSPPILRLPDFSNQFVLRTDASDTSLGAVLMQRHDGTLHPVAYASRKLLPREAAYSTIERECLALVWGVQKFATYLYGVHFLVQTDHQPLSYIQKARQLNSRVLRWSLLLQEYQFSVEHIKGKENMGADYLSRL
ncbi:uncharacterized protein ISCGN_001491 [Ixodes scapularis]